MFWDIDFDCDSVLRATDPARIGQLLNGSIMYGALAREADATIARAQASTEFKDRTGDLRKSYQYDLSMDGPDIVIRFYSPIPYSGAIEDGTTPHQIVPRRKSILRWDADGNTYWARKVNHPGTRARRVLASAINLENLTAAAGGAVVEILRG